MKKDVRDLNTTRGGLAGAGTQPAALAFGGNPRTNATEEWNAGDLTSTFTDA